MEETPQHRRGDVIRTELGDPDHDRNIGIDRLEALNCERKVEPQCEIGDSVRVLEALLSGEE